MRVLFFLCALLIFKHTFSQAKKAPAENQNVQRPKLVVGIVVDQMRWDYLYRFADRYDQNGFRRLVGQGFSCENTFIPYTPTYTAAGHACIYTGSVPAVNGIIGNNWYDRASGTDIYCADDSSVRAVGSASEAGKMSPRNMWSNTVCDELRLATNFKSKVIGIALKDRGSILPAGHAANAAYWFDDATGGWISSTYYMEQLPTWVKQLNSKKLPDQYMSKDWNTLYKVDSYDQSAKDKQAYESAMADEDNTFPHKTSGVSDNKYGAFRSTPFANTFTLATAKAAIEAEQLGLRNITDFLAVSLSSTDYIGHAFGPNSIEVEDTYLRLDKDLGDFLAYLDSKIGKGNYVLFLSADHGVAHVPGFMKENHLPAGVLDDAVIKELLDKSVARQFGIDSAILRVINYQVYLDENKITAAKKNEDEIVDFIVSQLLTRNEIANAYPLAKLRSVTLPDRIHTVVMNGYNQRRSGNVQFNYKPGYFDGGTSGTTHGSWNPYDSHIPLVWFGWHIKPGKTNRETYMSDIAPTVSALLHIQMPNGCVGKVIEEVSK